MISISAKDVFQLALSPFKAKVHTQRPKRCVASRNGKKRQNRPSPKKRQRDVKMFAQIVFQKAEKNEEKKMKKVSQNKSNNIAEA